MQVLKHENYLSCVELYKMTGHPTEMFQHVEQLAMLQVVHQDVDVAIVLGDAAHHTNHWIV